MPKYKNPLKNLKAFWFDQSGVAAMEFVLTFPILIALFLGCVELYGHFNAVRKLGNVTSSLADIVSQSRSISEGQLGALRPLSNNLMAPLDASGISYTISSISQGDAGDDPKLLWEYKHKSTGQVELNDGGWNCAEYTGAPDKDFPPNQNVIYVNVEYTYDSPFSKFAGGPTTYEDDMLTVPRASSKVSLTGESSCNL